MSEALGGGDGTPKRGRGGRGKVEVARASRAPNSVKRAKGQKRSAEELEQLTSSLGAYIKKNAGERVEQIAKGMSVTTKDLQLPVKKLVEAGAIKTKGQKRATQYFPR